jgi:gamma-glutamyl hydrolase
MRVSLVLVVALLALLASPSLASSPRARTRAHRLVRATAPGPSPTPNPRPIVGVFSLANSDDPAETGSIIPADYVKWLEQGGVRVAVVPFNAPLPVLDALFTGINGLLFTGGGLSLNATTLYFQQALYLFDKAKAANDAGDFFPIWGTCQGFQMLHLLAAMPANHADVLKCEAYDSENLPLALNFTDAAPTSQLFGPAALVPAIMDGASMHPTIYEAFGTQNITMNLHNCGVNPADFDSNPILPSFYTMLSTNVDRKGLPFVSSIEGIKYPFWATQFHPERTQFEWDLGERLSKTPQAVASSAYLSQRLAMQARESTHAFPDPASEAAALIYNYIPTFTGDGPGSYPEQQTYEFTFTYPSVSLM